MRRTIASATAAGLVLALSCGGESERLERTHSRDDAGESGVGGGGKAAGAAGCVTCGAGKAGRSGTPSFAGFGGAAVVGGAAGSSAGTAGFSSAGRPSAGAGGAIGSGGRATGGRGGASGASGAGGSGNAGSAGTTTAGGEGGMPAALDGLSISKVALYQGVEITLMRDGEDVDPNGPIVAERDGMMRIWLTPGPEFEERSVTVTLTLAGGNTSISPVAKLVSGPARDYDLASTVNVNLAGSELSETTTAVISVRDDATDEELARWPKSSTKALGAQPLHGLFEVVLVPFTVGGFTPDLVATSARFGQYLREMMPVSELSLSIREEPVVLPFDVVPNGTGWDEALDALYDTRDADDPVSNVYYYGVLTPGATFDDYCYEDCVVGLSSVAARSEEQYRGAIGTGYFENAKDTFSQETMVHELGHALGREHAPCGSPDGVDRRYPYEYGAIGVYGYHGGKLVDPDDSRDVMSYCTPVWISDYTYAALFERIAYVNGTAKRTVASTRGARARQRTLAVRADGTLRWGNERSPRSPAAGEPMPVELLDAAGGVVDVALVPFARLDHLPGGFLSVPSDLLSRPGVESVRVGGEVLRVP